MKTFIRYAPGAAGTFVALVLYSLSNKVDAEFKDGNAHDYMSIYSKSHNFDAIAYGDCLTRDTDSFALYQQYTEEEYNKNYPNLYEGVDWFKKNLKFDSSERHYIRTHARNLNSVLLAVEDANLVNITIQENDIDQMCYNFVTKAILTNPNWAAERADDTLPVLKYWYPKKAVSYDQLAKAIEDKDVKFLCWVIKLAWKNYWEKYPQYIPPDKFKVFEISWSEIADRSLINKIDDLAKFLNIRLDDNRRNNAYNLITRFALKQTRVPFTISVDDY